MHTLSERRAAICPGVGGGRDGDGADSGRREKELFSFSRLRAEMGENILLRQTCAAARVGPIASQCERPAGVSGRLCVCVCDIYILAD